MGGFPFGRKMTAKPDFERRANLPAGWLIVVSLVILLLLGALLLVQDRRLVFQDAEKQSQFAADQYARLMREELFEQFDQVYERVYNSCLMSPRQAGSSVAAGHTNLVINAPLLDELVRLQPVSPWGHVWNQGALVDDQGNLVAVGFRPARPGAYEPVPDPQPLDLSLLSETQKSLWEAANSPEPQSDAGGYPLEAFLETDPPPRFAALALFGFAQSQREEGRYDEAIEYLDRVLELPDTVLESGFPLTPLAALVRLEVLKQRRDASGASRIADKYFASVYSTAPRHPSLMTPLILKKASEIEREIKGKVDESRCTDVWFTDEGTRAFCQNLELRNNLSLLETSWFWSRWNGIDWLVIPIPPSDSKWYTDREGLEDHRVLTIHSELLAREAVFELIAASQLRPPDYAAIEVSLFGRRMLEFDFAKDYGTTPVLFEENREPDLLIKSRKKRPPDTTVLASASAPLMVGDNPLEGLQVNLLLARPSLLYARQQKRTLLFGALLLIAAGAAFAGYVFTKRAYARQQHLIEMKGNFVSSVSHELRAPVASMRLMAEGLESGRVAGESKIRQYYRFLAQECRRLSGLIENVLDFARIDQNRKVYEFEPTDIEKLIQETVQLMQPAAEERSLSLRPNLSSPGKQLADVHPCLDGRALQRALINLLDNAIKHSPEGQAVSIEVEVLENGPSSKTLRIAVTDHGPGIPADEREDIFKRFYRRGSELRRETQGVGIGLSIVQHIVEAHDGSVRVESEVGKGSRFIMEIPLRDRSDPEQTAE